MSKEPIKINKITEPVCNLYSPSEKYLGKIRSYLQLNDVRIQIMNLKLDGYYVVWDNDYKISIDKYGNMSEWPKGFYDLGENQLWILCCMG